MPGMKVTLSTAMRVRDVSRPSPQHEDDARAKVAQRPASRARKGGAASPRPWRPGADRGETPAARTGGEPRKGQGRPTPQAPHGTGQRPGPQAPHGTGQRPAPVPRDTDQRPPQEAVPAPRQPPAPVPQRPPALPPGHGEASGPVPARGKRVRRRRRRGRAGG
jgi:hypothetical protein